MSIENNNDVVFIYSETQIAAENEVARKAGKKYVCGTVYKGAIQQKYSKLVRSTLLEAVQSQYPDAKIVARGRRDTFRFTQPTKELLV